MCEVTLRQAQGPQTSHNWKNIAQLIYKKTATKDDCRFF